ncbi:hypothetical protein BN1708_018021, partial [Verticillium longisporum]
KDDPDRAAGSWNQTVGSAKEAVGGLVGSQNLKEQGRQQNLEGQQQEAKGQVNDFASGVGNRLQGSVGGAVAGLTGDKSGQQHYQDLHDTGKTQQRFLRSPSPSRTSRSCAPCAPPPRLASVS